MTTTLSNIEFCHYKKSMYPKLKALMQHCYEDMGGEYASEEEMNLLSDLYARGQIVAFDSDRMVGGFISRIVPFESYNRAHIEAQILNLSEYVSDAAKGNALYGLDVFVHADYRRLKLGNAIYEMLLSEYKKDNFTHFVGASRVSNFSQYADKISLLDYVKSVKNGEIKDGALTFHLKYGFEIYDVMHDFNEEDIISSGCAAALGSANPEYNPNLPTYKERSFCLNKLMANAA